MWRSLWRSIDRFSLQHFKHVVCELREIKVVDQHNKELVIDLLQSIVEIVTYGDRQDPAIFECFMEYQVLAEFVRVLKISKNSRIEAPLLQYLSIMIQNLSSEHAIYYCFSNGHINDIIVHRFEFNRGDLAQYYVSFLRAISSKINRDTLCLLVKVHKDSVVSFPLFDEALKFAGHEEKMIQTAIRSLSLNIYNVSDDMVYQYITTAPVSKYFSDLVLSLKEQCSHLDVLVHDPEDACIHTKRKQLFLQAEKIVDDLYYFKDILDTGEPRLIRSVTENLLRLLVFPALHPLMKLKKTNVLDLSTATCVYLLSRLLQVLSGKGIINPVAIGLLYPYMNSRFQDGLSGRAVHDNGISSSISGLKAMKEMLFTELEFEEEKINYPPDNVCIKRSGIAAFICSEDHSLMLQLLFLLLIIAESKDLDCSLHPIIGLNGMNEADENFFSAYRDQILKALLKVLASQAPFSVLIKWHTGWFLRKLLIAREKRIDDHNLQLFNTSYEQSRENLEGELDGCWFDQVPDTLRTEWTSCRTFLEESCQSKDPLFALELSIAQHAAHDDKTGNSDWQRMVDTVKVFVLHLHLKSYIFRERSIEHPLVPTHSLVADAGQTHASDTSNAGFGSEVSLASAVPCKIAFSNAGIRDIYICPVANGTSGRLLLAEKHPFRSQRGVILAIAPLAGLSPKIDEENPWLRLQIREFDPRLVSGNAKGNRSNVSNNHVPHGRWTLGFQSMQACEAARSLIVEETKKQRSNVRNVLAPVLLRPLFEDLSSGEDQ